MVKHFAHNIKLLRKEWGLSQQDLAERFDVTQGSAGRWESGTEPNFDILIGLAEFFKLSIDDLLTKKLTREDVPSKYGTRREGKPGTADEPGAEYFNSDKLAALVAALTERIDKLDERISRLED